MKTSFKFFVLAFVMLTVPVLASKWMIDSFDDSPDPGDPDNYIAAEFGSGLKPVKPNQVTAQSGRFYVRQKFEDLFGDDATYQIYQGRTTDATPSLGKISLDGIPYTTILKMKFFYTRSASGDDDLETVYFDGKDIFVEGEDPVYVNLNGRMEELKPAVLKDYKISITSTPPGATVTVGNNERGKTPVTFSVTSTKTLAVVVSMDGHYSVIRPITPAERGVTQESITLTKKQALENPAETFRSQLQRSSKDAAAMKTLKQDIQKALNTFTADTKKRVDAVLAKFPANPPKLSAESSSDYSTRQAVWTNTQSKERDALNKEAQEHFNELKALLAEVDAAGGDMDFSLKYEYVPTDAIDFTNIGVRDFTISVSHKSSNIGFNYDKAKIGYGSLSRGEIENGQDQVHGVLKIWDKPDASGKSTSIYDIAFFYDETPLKILSKGTFSVDGASNASRNTERDLNSRIAKFPQKSAWDKKDETATLDALRAGVRATRASSKSVAKAPKYEEEDEEDYYDEDEDEEEFENGMSNQRDSDYSRYGATQSAADIFGNTDEYLFWAGMFFAATAIGTGVVGFLEHKKYSEFNEAIDAAADNIAALEKEMDNRCGGRDNDCYRLAYAYSSNPGELAVNSNGELIRRGIWEINQNKKANTEKRDTYNKSRIIWFSGAAVSLGLSITLFLW